MKMKKATAVALAAAMAAGTLGFGVPAKASELVKTTDYTITIPAALSVKGKGWNATTGITAKRGAGDAFDSEKKLTVTAESENGWKLKAEGGTDTIGYNLAASGDTNSVYSAEAPAASWDFQANEITAAGTNKGMGIVVEDYTTKAAGNYTDTVTFTAKVEDAAVAVTGILLNKSATTIAAGSNETLIATVEPGDATDKTVTWESDNTTVATVDANGKVTAVAKGTANITAKAGGKTATCVVTVANIKTVTITQADLTSSGISKDGVTVTGTVTTSRNMIESGTISTSSGNFTKIEVTAGTRFR